MPELYPDDQDKVNRYLETSVNSVERAPFRPLRLLAIIFAVLALLTWIAFLVAADHGLA